MQSIVPLVCLEDGPHLFNYSIHFPGCSFHQCRPDVWHNCEFRQSADGMSVYLAGGLQLQFLKKVRCFSMPSSNNRKISKD